MDRLQSTLSASATVSNMLLYALRVASESSLPTARCALVCECTLCKYVLCQQCRVAGEDIRRGCLSGGPGLQLFCRLLTEGLLLAARHEPSCL